MELDELERRVEAEIVEAIRLAHEDPFPDPASLVGAEFA